MTRTYRLMVSKRGESRQYTVTIPAAIVDAFWWGEGTELEYTVEGKGILKLREVRGVNRGESGTGVEGVRR